MQCTNAQVAQLLRNVSAAYQIKGGNRFQVVAYDTAASAIEHATSEAKDLWEQGSLGETPGIGERIEAYLDELFRTGRVTHFDKVLEGIPDSVFPLLEIPGVGPKTAMKLVGSGVTSITDLQRRIAQGVLKSSGWSEKKIAQILAGIESFKRRSHRMLFPVAFEFAEKVLIYLRSSPNVLNADMLGSLRRKVATIGDIDIAVAAVDKQGVLKHFLQYPHAIEVESGQRGATIELPNGIRIDLLVTDPDNYGAVLQHYTGSKQHNIHLRSIAQGKGLSLSEYGIIDKRTGQKRPIQDEEELYSSLDMQMPPPELREDTGEIEAAQEGELPRLVEVPDIKGDLHIHTNWSDGVDSIERMVDAAHQIGHEYVGITDHSYPSLDFTKRSRAIASVGAKSKIHVLSGLEVNITIEGKLQVSDAILAQHDFVIAAIHTGFQQEPAQITRRMLAAMEHPKVAIIAHPTGRVLLEREGYEADWEKIFEACKEKHVALEINAYPNRLDLPDTLVRKAVQMQVPLVINTDAHAIKHLSNLAYGVAVARRGWAQAENILNTLSFQKLCDRLNIK